MQPESATSELVLPGLDAGPPMTEPRPGHWIERGPSKRLMVFAGRSHHDLAARITDQLGVDEVVAQYHHEYDGRPIREFVPILVERDALDHLSSESDSGRTAPPA